MNRALLLVLLAPAVALAQPAGDKVDAQSLMKSGVKLLEAKDYLGALAIFKNAYDRFPSAKILLNIGTTLKLLGRDADAANIYQRYLDSPDADPKRQADVEKILGKIDANVGQVELHVAPPDAQLTVDDGDWLNAVRGPTWRLAPGHHVFTARRDGSDTATKSIDITAGESVSLSISLAETPKPVAVAGPDEGLAVRERAPAPARPRSRFGVLAFGNFDIPHGGAALVGATADVTSRLAIRAAAILGPNFGAYAGATFAILPHRYRPYVSAGVPLFVSAGARVGVRGAVGFEYEIDRHIAVSIEAGVEHTFNPQMTVDATAFVPAIGVIGRL